jgi:hypothetical protein
MNSTCRESKNEFFIGVFKSISKRCQYNDYELDSWESGVQAKVRERFFSSSPD